MPPYPHPPARGSRIAVALLALVLYGCAARPDSPGSSSPAVSGPAPRAAAQPVATVVDARPAALVDGRSVPWGELRPALSDVAGAEALREVILDRALERETADAGLVVTEDDVAAEERRLLGTLSDDPNIAVRLLTELRDGQNLGRVRFRALLRRNAILRALVRDAVEVTETAVEELYDARHGPRRQVRVLTTDDLHTATSAIQRARSGAFFGDLAVELSTDASAARGGLLEGVSRLDPSYPAALRQAIWSIGRVGDLSDATLLGDGYAVVQLVREIPASGPPLATVRAELEATVRLSRERVLMEQLARRIIAGSQVTIFDDALDDSWKRYKRKERRRLAN